MQDYRQIFVNIVLVQPIVLRYTEDRHLGLSEIVRLNYRGAIVAKLITI